MIQPPKKNKTPALVFGAADVQRKEIYRMGSEKGS